MQHERALPSARTVMAVPLVSREAAAPEMEVVEQGRVTPLLGGSRRGHGRGRPSTALTGRVGQGRFWEHRAPSGGGRRSRGGRRSKGVFVQAWGRKPQQLPDGGAKLTQQICWT